MIILKNILSLAGWLVICFAASGIASIATVTGTGTWYDQLDQPAWAPPDWVFSPVWITLYALMAIAAWLIWLKKGISGAPIAFTLFFIQLALNVAWSFIFFGAREIAW